jgi:hypothetical protein
MKNADSFKSGGEVGSIKEHIFLNLLKDEGGPAGASDLSVKEDSVIKEMALYNFLRNISKDFPFYYGEFTLEFIKKKLNLRYSVGELVDGLKRLDQKYYTQCSFDDQGRSVWIKML